MKAHKVNYLRIIRTLAFLIFVLGFQLKPAAQIRFGPEIGTNVSEFWTPGVDNNSQYSNLGYSIGGTASIPFWKFLSIESGIYISSYQLGYKFEAPGNFYYFFSPPTTVKLDQRISYFSVPVYLGASFKLFNHSACFFSGIQASRFLKGKTELKEGGNDFIGTKTISYPWEEEKSIAPWLLGYDIGFSYSISRFRFSTKFSFGLNNTRPTYTQGGPIRNQMTKADYVYDAVYLNRLRDQNPKTLNSLSFSVAYLFNFKKKDSITQPSTK